jgi:hypothetical protein
MGGIADRQFAEVKDKFDDPKVDFTFFAPNDDALKPPPGFPHHRHGHHGDHDHHGHHGHHGHHDHDHDDDHDSLIAAFEQNPSLDAVVSFLDSDAFRALDEKHDGDDDDDKKKKRREIFRYIVKKVLEYHVLPHPMTAAELAENSTVATACKADDGSFAGLHRRIKIEKQLVPPSIYINFYARVIDADKKASNGIIHVINHPLIPPASLFDTFYQFPDFFSTLTQSVYGLHAKEYLDWHYDRELGSTLNRVNPSSPASPLRLSLRPPTPPSTPCRGD